MVHKTTAQLLLENKLEILLCNAHYCNFQELAYRKVINFLDRMPIKQIVSILHNNSRIFEKLSDQKYSAYWLSVLKKIDFGLSEGFRFKKPNFISSLQFILGYFFAFSHLEKCSEDGVIKINILDKAIQYHSYHALYFLSDHFITLMYENFNSNEKTIKEGLELFKKEALYNGTPGLLLIANFLFHLTLSTRARVSSSEKGEDRLEKLIEADSYLLNTLKYLDMASFLESYSKNEINNAYLGEPLSFSNPFDIPSISLMKEECYKLFSKKLLAGELEAIQYEAKTELRTMLKDQKKFPLNNGKSSELIQTRKIINFIKLIEDDKIPINSSVIAYLKRYVSLDSNPESILLLAVRLHAVKTLKLLIQAGIKLKAQDRLGNTALHLAAFLNNQEIVALLINKDSTLLQAKNSYGQKAIDLVEDAALGELLLTKAQTLENTLSFCRSCNENLFFSAQSTNLPTPRQNIVSAITGFL